MNIAVCPPTETEMALSAHVRHSAFHQKIAAKAAALAAQKRAVPCAVAPEAVPAEPDPPAPAPVFTLAKEPWFYIEHVSGKKTLSIREIQFAVCNLYGLTPVVLTAERRTAPIVRARQVAMWLARELTGRSLPEIGRRFGGKDHTTVIHACRRIDALMAVNADLAAEVAKLRAELEALL